MAFEEDYRAAEEELLVGAHRLGISLQDDQRQRFVTYCRTLHEANQTTNLTGMRSPQAIVKNLFLDSLTLVSALPQSVRAAPSARVVDVGSGAGIPGIPLKILYPTWHLALVESIGKKALFLATVVERLALRDVMVLGERVETLGADLQWRDAADLCLARAVAPLPSLLELCAPLVRAGGILLFPKSSAVQREIHDAETAASALGAQLLEVRRVPSQEKEDRLLVVYEKQRRTPSGYPRRVGLARSRPISRSSAGD